MLNSSITLYGALTISLRQLGTHGHRRRNVMRRNRSWTDIVANRILVLVAAIVWLMLGGPAMAALKNGSVDDLRTQFNNEQGHTRIVALLSPT